MADYWLPSASTAGRSARAAGQSLWPVLVLLEEFWTHLGTQDEWSSCWGAPGVCTACTRACLLCGGSTPKQLEQSWRTSSGLLGCRRNVVGFETLHKASSKWKAPEAPGWVLWDTHMFRWVRWKFLTIETMGFVICMEIIFPQPVQWSRTTVKGQYLSVGVGSAQMRGGRGYVPTNKLHDSCGSCISNASALSALSICYNLSDSYKTCKQECLKVSEFRKVISSPVFRFYYNPEVLWRGIKALQSGIFGIHVASGIFKG